MAKDVLSGAGFRRVANHYNAGMISDTHFGKLHTNAAFLYEFLLHHRFDKLYLNGDFFDGWKMMAKKQRDFPEMQKRVIDLLFYMVDQEQTELVYIPGNHDDRLRALFNDKSICSHANDNDFIGSAEQVYAFGKQQIPVTIKPHDIYETLSEEQYLIIHGDEFDPPWLKTNRGIALSKIADQVWHEWFKGQALPIEREVQDILARKKKHTKFSLAKYMKGKFDNREEVRRAFTAGAINIAREQELDGVICGHVHHLLREEVEGTLYLNSGDWDDGAGAIVFGHDGVPVALDWMVEREVLGLAEEPPLPDNLDYVGSAYRPVTEEILNWAQIIWPAKGQKKGVIDEKIEALSSYVPEPVYAPEAI